MFPPTPEATALASAQALELAHQTKVIGDCLLSAAFWGGAGLTALWFFRRALLGIKLPGVHRPKTILLPKPDQEISLLEAQGGRGRFEMRPKGNEISRDDGLKLELPKSF